MNTNNEIENLFKQIEQDFIHQEFYGLQYIIDDLFHDFSAQYQKNTLSDWYGFDDLNID